VVEGCPVVAIIDESVRPVTRLDALVAVERECAAIQQLLQQVRQRLDDGEDVGFRAMEVAVGERAAAIERAAVAALLTSYDIDRDVVEVGGRQYKRLAEPGTGRYFTLRGEVPVNRHLFREVGVHNGPTIVPLELRAGIAHGRWTPEAFQAVGHLHQALPSRELKDTADRLHVLPYSRATLARAGEQVGRDWEDIRVEAEDTLITEMELPEEAVALSVSVDRVTVPMEEAITPPPKDPKAPKIEVAFRQAYCACVTLHDEEGEALASIRYGRMPADGHGPIEDALAGDVATLVSRRPDLRLVGLADGSPEMQSILDRALKDQSPEAISLDIWHVLEKLGDAVKSTGRDAGDYVPKWKAQLKRDDAAIDQIDAQIRDWLDETHEEDVPDALYDAFTYLDNNKDRMRYATLVAANLPIGSGGVEATCKTLASVRMKRSGSRWKTDGGQSCLNLRALSMSSRWEPAMEILTNSHVRHVAWAQAA
jgi:hypothetical protein